MVIGDRVSAGSYDLNKFLFGGYERDIITTMYGPGGSGKTNLCMILAVSQAKKGHRVLYVDTEGGFSTERFKQIHGGDTASVTRDLQNIFLLKPTSFVEQEESFDALLNYVKKGDVSVIIIDSVGMLYRLELGDAIMKHDEELIQRVNRKLASQLRVLNEIARKQGIAVVVTNQVYASFSRDDVPSLEKKISMVGGDLLKYWSKCLIELQVDRGRRKLVLRKHRSLPEKDMFFDIVGGGIKKRGIF